MHRYITLAKCSVLFFLLLEKQEARGKLTRMNTTMKFDNASEAIRRYESIDKPYFNEKDEVTSENDPDDGMATAKRVILP